MIFLCFSSKDRYEIVESIYYHLNNIGIPVWYDRQEILMGNNRINKNFTEGVEACSYAIILLSPNSIASIYANEEINLIYQRYLNRKMYVFPVFYNITADKIPAKYSWMMKLVYKELNTSIDSRSLCNHVACKYYMDLLEQPQYKYKTIAELGKLQDKFISSLVLNYIQVDGYNFNARIALLYAGFLYFQSRVKLPETYIKGLKYIFNETKLDLTMDLRDTIIFEKLFLLSANYYLPPLK